jgi:ssDNA-binding Zn-finger/Zn-ribbon topoisomerase 1
MPSSHLQGNGCRRCGADSRGKQRRKTLEDFIVEARAVHGDRYDYTQVDYQGAHRKVTIVCPDHGTFEQAARDHTAGKGCRQCRAIELSDRFSWTTEEFIAKAREVHGDYYDYRHVDYKNQSTPVTIVCPEHGEMSQLPGNHVSGKGCWKCARAKIANAQRGTTEEFIARAQQVHGHAYDYTKVNYRSTHEPVTIICREHGAFSQSPSSHLHQASGCIECGKRATADKLRMTTKDFIAKARQVHGDRFDYSKVDYRNSDSNITIVCPKHGAFEQLPYNHLDGKGCERCARELQGQRQRSTTEEFITKARKVHGDRFDYGLVAYQSAIEKVTIVCREHGPFVLTPNSHLSGTGCDACTESKGEFRIAELLDKSVELYHREWMHPECVDSRPLRFDFFAPALNLLIEYDGRQHFEAVDLFGGEDSLAETQRRDQIKNGFADENGYRLLRIPYWDFQRIDQILAEAISPSVADCDR